MSSFQAENPRLFAGATDLGNIPNRQKKWISTVIPDIPQNSFTQVIAVVTDMPKHSSGMILPMMKHSSVAAVFEM
jgi:hypothetical protein